MPGPPDAIALDEERLRFLGDHLPAGAVFIRGERAWLNERAGLLLDLPSGTTIPLADLFARLFGEQAAEIRDAFRSGQEGAFTAPAVLSVSHRNGIMRQVEITPGAPGPFSIWLLRDVTDEQRLDRLRAQTQHQAGMGSWELDCHTLAIYWSPEIYRLFDLDPCSHKPEAFDCLQYMSEPSQAAMKNALQMAMEQGIPFDLEVEIASAKKRRANLHCHGQVETDAAGKPLRLYGWCQDVTRQRGEERARELLESQVRQAQKLESLSVLAGGIAHDFNNLLTTILGYTSLTRMELPADSRLQEFLHEVEKASRRAAELTQQMLAYSGKGRYLLTPLRPQEVVHDMLPLLQATIGQTAQLTLDLPADLPLLNADLHQLRQVILSLICNAAEAIDKAPGKITLRASRRYLERPSAYSPFATTDSRPGWFLSLQIEDNGVGMSQDVLTRMFDPFFSTKFAGRGLGMAAVLGIIKGHKGLIHVESERGHGTRVEVLLPLDPEGQQPPAQADARPTAPLVLVVEDEDAVRQLAQQILRSGGYQVIAAADGIEGEELFRQKSDQLAAVLLDLVMPRRGGEECLPIFRSINPKVPIFVMSGFSMNELGDRFATHAPDGFLQKPYARNDLLEFLDRHLKGRVTLPAAPEATQENGRASSASADSRK